MRWLLSLWLLLALSVNSLFGQNKSSNKDLWANLWQNSLLELFEDGQITAQELSTSRENLERLLDEPIDINQGRAEDFRKIPFLSDFQIYQLIHYRTNRHQHKLFLSDLKTIKSWDRETLLRVLPFLRGAEDEDTDQRNPYLFTEGKTKFNLLFGKRHQAEDEQYLGSPSALALRCQYLKPNKFKIFLGAEQDYCEPWQWYKHKGFDSYAYSFALKDRLNFKQIILGDYRVSWGEGLCLRQGFRLRDYTPSLTYRNRLSAISGLSKSNKFRGIATLWSKGKVSLMAFVSKRHLDGRIDEDNFIYGLSENGLHRTEKDWERRGQVPMRSIGFQTAFSLGQLSFALHHLYYDFTKDYYLAHATGASRIGALDAIQEHHNTGFSYQWHSRRGTTAFSGELARNSLGALAYTQSASLHLNLLGDFALRFRSISPRYWAYYAQTSTHFLRPNNERGLTLIFSSRELINNTKLDTYIDLYKSIEPFDNGAERKGKLFGLKVIHRINTQLNLESQLSLRQDNNEASRLRFGLKARQKINQSITSDLGLTTSKAQDEWGYMLYHKARYELNKKMDISSSILYHNIPNWAGRIYYYEPQLPYQYQSLFLYKKGFRASLRLQLKLNKHWSLGAKFAYHSFKQSLETRKLIALSLSFR